MRSFPRLRPQTQKPRSYKQATGRVRSHRFNRTNLGFDIWMAKVRLTSEWQDRKPAVRTIAV